MPPPGWLPPVLQHRTLGHQPRAQHTGMLTAWGPATGQHGPITQKACATVPKLDFYLIFIAIF